MLVASSSGHLEDDVDQGSSLGDLPVNAGSAARNLAEVDNEVADRAEAEESSDQNVREKHVLLTSCSGWCTIEHRRQGRGRRLQVLSDIDSKQF